jgi:uncharacterized damage-inducible protein DinB
MLYPSLTNRLENQHTAIEHIVAGLNDDPLMRNPAPGKWSIHDNITHLAVYQPMFIKRIDAILEQDNPTFNPYKADNDPVFIAWQQWPTEKLLENLSADRKQLYELITNLPEDKLGRTGTHLTFGTLTITKWVEFFLLHEAHHLFTIFKLANSK